MTDAETGEVLNHYTYDAFGNTMECSEQVHNRFRYNGEQYDPLTNQYYLRARFYNPVIARFTQEDTYYGDGLNLYQYCANNPIGYVDPSGHNICPVQLALYKKYKEEGLSPQDAYKRMREELGLTAKNPFTSDSEGGTKAWYQREDLEGLSLYDAFEKIKAEKGLSVENPYKIGDYDTGIPTAASGKFESWFNSLSVNELNKLWKEKAIRKAIERQLRAPGKMHEWLMVSRAPKFKEWGIEAGQIWDLRTPTKDVIFANPYGKHGGVGSTKAHNEILAIIDSASDFDSFVQGLNVWSDTRLAGVRGSLPAGLQK